MMIERNEPIHSVIFFDTGWEFPGMTEHVDLLEKRTGIKIWRLYPRLPFEYEMLYKPIKKKSGEGKGEVYRYGNNWPSPMRRWCTSIKVSQLHYFGKTVPGSVQCVGYAADEKHRDKDNSTEKKRYPLIEWGITEADALQYCYDNGYDWGGLYEIFNRVSCFCCPLQRLSELRKLRNHFPDLWAKMLDWDSRQPKPYLGFREYTTVWDLDRRFAEEDRQMDLFPEMEAL